MQVITSRRAPGSRASRRSLVVPGLVGLALVVAGTGLGYLAVATPFVARLMEGPRVAPTQVAFAVLAWSVAVVVPAGFILIGSLRLLEVAEPFGRRRAGPVARLARTLSGDYVAATDVRLPDGRTIPELVVGPHGVAIFEELPPARFTRQVEGRWEARLTDGRWIALENPLERAARDADRVRRWLATDDRDFVVKVYPALIAPDLSLARTPSCAVITRDQVPAFLAALPPQRTLTAGRRQSIVDHVRGAA